MILTPVTPKGRVAPPRGAPSSDSGAVAARHAAFDAQQAWHAEMLRELAALETLLLAQLKNEDEIMKKWIALI